MDIPDNFVKQAVAGAIDHDAIDEYCFAGSLDATDFWNAVALTIARRYMNGEMSFHDGDAAMNSIWASMCTERIPFAEPAYSIFLAFDSGEYDHGDGSDPAEKYTRPELEHILKEA